ncbi:UDP-N-acetylmuramate dehydrogenase [Segetibacter koreensis]|uniref:UDP-N-acetylmuramate dehydrogenase n=1 Tax=Segetibacter koreensis TaxID=398037 RepID=UPI00037ADF33|nr:UDP-N-acetylmuramate dehydrogenase [Segetibacter koreensis]
MQIQENISLKPYNTFHINATARYFTKFSSLQELGEVFDFDSLQNEVPVLVLGGGSNILLTHDYRGLVAINEMHGIEVLSQDSKHVYVRAAAGENWHKFVLFCIENYFAGVENLSLIPGSVGASPMQNIGAYGVEIKDVFYELEAYNIKENKLRTFSAKDCRFGYRESIFKRKYKGKFVITSVTFKLKKHPVFNTSYGAIQQELDKMGVKDLSIAAISKAVINIRESKLPDPNITGNAGSFFKNPTIPKDQFERLQAEFPGIIGFSAKHDTVKVAAGWLIEQCGWKGYRKGDVGCHEKQALVLVNYGNANGIDIYDLSTQIMHSVENKFGIMLEREVNVI